MSNKFRVLCLVHGDFSSHTVRVMAIANVLRNTGRYDILFSGSGPYMKFIEEAGYKYVDTKTISGEDYVKRSEENNLFGLYDKETVDYLFEVEDNLLKKYKPDIIIRDFMREGAGIAAKKNHVFDVLLEQINLGPNFEFDFMPMNLEAFAQRSNVDYKKLISAMRKNISKEFQKKVQELGITASDHNVEGVEADLILVPDSELLYDAKLISDKYKYIGPVMHFGQQQEPEWKEEFRNSRKKKIVITGGTTGRWDHTELFEAAIDTEKYTVAMYTNEDRILKGSYGGKFEIISIIDDADLFIHHGGLGSSYIGLSYGKPMISLYNDTEQQTTSVYLKRLGVAECSNARKTEAIWLSEKIDQLLGDKIIKENAEKYKGLIDFEGYKVLALKYIEEGYEKYLNN